MQLRMMVTALMLAAVSVRAQDVAPLPDSPILARARIGLLWAGSADTQSFLGVAVAEVNSNRALELKLNEERGVEITRIEEGSAASKAGLKVGDVVLEYSGQRVEGAEQFIRLVRETPAGREITLTIARGGPQQKVRAVMGSRKLNALLGNREADWMRLPVMPSMPPVAMPPGFPGFDRPTLGIEVEGVSGQLAEFFGVKEGVLVRAVLKNSPAEAAGLRAGDVIVKLGRTTVTASTDVAAAVRAALPSKSLQVEVVREKKAMSFNLTLDQHRAEPDFAPLVPRGRAIRL